MKLSADQIELQDMIRRFFEQHVSSDYRRHRISAGTRVDSDLRVRCNELGLAEGFGGVDPPFGASELAILAYESGRLLVPEHVPDELLASCIAPNACRDPKVSAALRAQFGSDASVGLAPIAGCTLTATVASNSAAFGNDDDQEAPGITVSGDVAVISALDVAQHALVWIDAFDAKVTGAAGANQKIAHSPSPKNPHKRAAIINLSAKGVTVSQIPSLDLTASLSAIALEKVAVSFLFGTSASAEVADILDIVRANEMAGIANRALEMTCDYVRTREQFNVPVGGFQALQHSLAQCHARTESLRALARFAAWSVSSAPDQRPLAARSAAIQAAIVGPEVCEAAIQAHGGIGFTWEYDLHLYLRRARTIAALYGATQQRATELLHRAMS